MPPDDTTPDVSPEPTLSYPSRHLGVTVRGLTIRINIAPGCSVVMELTAADVERMYSKMLQLQHDDEQGPQLKLVRTRREESED